jgi:hypothetical protein
MYAATLVNLFIRLPWQSASADRRHTKTLIVGGGGCSPRIDKNRSADGYIYLHTPETQVTAVALMSP